MLLTLATILVAIWLFLLLLKVGGALIHLLLIIALVVFIYDLLVRRKSSVS